MTGIFPDSPRIPTGPREVVSKHEVPFLKSVFNTSKY